MALFKKDLIRLVQAGRKTQTRRTHKREWQVGKIYKVKISYYDKGQGIIKITRKFHQHLCDVSESEARKEGFNCLDEFRQCWIKINGSWNPDQTVTVYEFSYIPQKRLSPSNA